MLLKVLMELREVREENKEEAIAIYIGNENSPSRPLTWIKVCRTELCLWILAVLMHPKSPGYVF